MKPRCKTNRYMTESGASLTEYVIIAALLVAVSAYGFVYIQNKSEGRGEASMGTVSDMVPCDNQAISGDGCL